MALHDIPCIPNGVPHWTQRTQLDGTEYLLTFDWNQRAGHWSLSIADIDGEALHTGIVLVTGMALLNHNAGVGSNLREFIVIDNFADTGLGTLDPGFADLGDRFSLVYSGLT